MHILSVQTGSVRTIAPDTSRAVDSGIDKRPTESITLQRAGVVGDQIQRPEVHGGEGQAVYLYAREDYAYWEDLLGHTFAPGSFGENVTVDQWRHVPVRVGDRLVLDDSDGSRTEDSADPPSLVELEITGVRVPCKKFAARMREMVGEEVATGWVKRFTRAERPGFYARVITEGVLEPGQSLDWRQADAERIGALELAQIFTTSTPDRAQIDRALASPTDGRIRRALLDLIATH